MRLSSTQQSEYSNPQRDPGLSGLPASSRSRRSVRVGGSSRRPPRWSYRNKPSRSSQAGRWPRACGSTKRSGHTICGAMRQITSRSCKASRTRRNSQCSR